MSTETEKSPLEQQLEAWAREATPGELQDALEPDGPTAVAARAEIQRRADELENRRNLPASIAALGIDPEQLLVDAIRLHRIALELYGEGDIHMRAKQPRFRRANTVIQDTNYLVGGESICTGQPNCQCKACEAYMAWMERDAEEREAGDAQERAAGGGRLS